MANVKVRLEMDRCGYLHMDPVNQRLLKKCKKRIISYHKEGSPQMHTGWQKEDTEKWLNSHACAFFQTDYVIMEVLEDLGLTNSEKDDLNMGWSVTKLVNSEVWEHLFCVANEMPYEA